MSIPYHTGDCTLIFVSGEPPHRPPVQYKTLCFCHAPPSGHTLTPAGSGSILMLLMLMQRSNIASYCIATYNRTKAVANKLMVDSLNPDNGCWRWAPSLPSCMSITTMTYGNVGTVEIKNDAIRTCESTWRAISGSLCLYISTLFLLM